MPRLCCSIPTCEIAKHWFRCIAIPTAVILFAPNATAQDPCEPIRSNDVDCQSQELIIYKKAMDGLTYVRSTTMDLPIGRFMVGCCVEVNQREIDPLSATGLRLVRTALPGTTVQDSSFECQAELVPDILSIERLIGDPDAWVEGFEIPPEDAEGVESYSVSIEIRASNAASDTLCGLESDSQAWHEDVNKESGWRPIGRAWMLHFDACAPCP